MKSAGVTSVILAGDPVFPTFLTQEATAQDCFPEWVVLGYAFTDTAVFGRQYDQQQWAHAFGVSLLPARTADDVDELGEPHHLADRAPAGGEDVPRAGAGAADLLHRRAPRRARSSPRRRSPPGSFRFPPAATTVPTRLHLSWGKHGIWKGVDLTGGDDATVIWWDPDAKGADEVGRDGKGLYRYADDGTRYLPGQWPKATHHVVRPEDVDGRARHAAAGGPAAELPLARSLIRALIRTLLRGRRSVWCSRPHPALALDVPADHAGRVADGDAEVGQRAGDHRARADRDVAADVAPGQHHRCRDRATIRAPTRTGRRRARTAGRSAA